jgi:hypothetical protein
MNVHNIEEVAPQAVAASQAPGISKEDLEVISMVKEQVAGILKASKCILVPITTIVNGRIFQAIEIMRQPEKSALTAVQGGKIITP